MKHPVATVGALICDAGGDVLMIRTHKWSDKWGIPGGKVEWGELLENGMKREIFEETGLYVTNVEFIVIQEAIKPKIFHKEAHFILVNYIAKVSGRRPPVALNDEAEDYIWVSPANALLMDINIYTKVLLSKFIEKKEGKEDERK